MNNVLEKPGAEVYNIFIKGLVRQSRGLRHSALVENRSGKTIVTLYVRDGYFDAVIILGGAEREKFEARADDFSHEMRKIYDGTRTYHDGKWLCVPVREEADLDDAVKLLNIKRRPIARK